MIFFFVFTPYCFNPLFLKPCVISSEGTYHLEFIFSPFIYLWLCWVFTARWAFLQLQCLGCHCGGFSYCRAQALRCLGFSGCGAGLSSCSSRNRLSSSGAPAQLLHHMWDLPGSGVEPVSPASEGGFFTAEPPGKPYSLL